MALHGLARLPQLGQGEEIGLSGGRQRHAGHLRAQALQPQGQPGTFEAGVAGDQHAFAAPEVGIRAHRGYQHFQGARPDCHRSSSRFFSRSVSIGCQKPVCSKARSWPLVARRAMGSSSQLVASPSM